AARRVFQALLLEERDALHALGFENFEAFEAMHGYAATATPTEEPPAGETIGRIRVLLDELGVEPGADPLQAAKEFLDVVEGPGVRPPDVTPSIGAPEQVPGAPEPEAAEETEEEAAAVTVAEEIVAPATAAGPTPAGEPLLPASNERALEQ